MDRLKDKIALVTGAGQGIGQAIARAMAAQGAFVYVTDMNEETAAKTTGAIKAAGGEAVVHGLNVVEPEGWQKMADIVRDRHGRLDILVNNAGVELVKPIEQISLEDWRWVQSINVEGCFLGCKTMLDLMKESGRRIPQGAAIVNLSSVAGIIAFNNQLAYNTSKGAVRQMTKGLAIEFAENGYNIRANSIHPGCIDTQMLQEVFELWAKDEIISSDTVEISRQMAALHPLGRMGTPEDIANGAVYLSSNEAGFVTGAELVIDGGWIAR